MAASAESVSTAASADWKIFADLDLHSEAEQIRLAGFLDSLLREFGRQSQSGAQLLEEEDDDAPFAGGDDDCESSGSGGGSGGGVAFNNAAFVGVEEQGSLLNWGPLPKGPISKETALAVIDVYRRGGKLSLKSVKKILRDAYKSLKAADNIIHVPSPPSPGRIHIIGDLHGQLRDLLHIFDDAGLPSSGNVFIFNGDFVDRGPCSVEILMVLFSSYLAFPDSVFLNRGNHEDHMICCQPPPPHGCGGFQRECQSKYDDLTFSMCCEVFRYLSLVHIVDTSIMVVHGGLFGRTGVTLDDLASIDRLDYSPAPPDEAEPTCEEESRVQDRRQLMRDILWSDPKASDGVKFNTARKQGQLFGPDMTKEFLQTNDLLMIVRSHECVKNGWDRPFVREPHLLCTVFSASGYSGSSNLGAYLSFSRTQDAGSIVVGGDDVDGKRPPLYYCAHEYSMAEAADSLEQANKTSIKSLILRKRQELLDAFEQQDSEKTELISEEKWATTMATVTGFVIDWVQLIPLLEAPTNGDGHINYRAFITHLRAGMTKLSQQSDDALFNAMYANRGVLEMTFNFFDENGDGIISRQEFRRGCQILNERLPEQQFINDPDAILQMMDVDGNEGIDINEFFEVFRIVDGLDGKMDGNFDILNKERQ